MAAFLVGGGGGGGGGGGVFVSSGELLQQQQQRHGSCLQVSVLYRLSVNMAWFSSSVLY